MRKAITGMSTVKLSSTRTEHEEWKGLCFGYGRREIGNMQTHALVYFSWVKKRDGYPATCPTTDFSYDVRVFVDIGSYRELGDA